jgi:hypothetical protein
MKDLAKDGLMDKRIELMAMMSRNSATREIIEASALQKNHEASVMDTIQRLRKDAADRNTELLIEAESLMLAHSLARDANSPEETKSLENAMKQIGDCKKAFGLLKNDPEAYQKVEATYSAKQKDNSGLPNDAAREFFKSHKTRLDNNLRSAVSHADKLLIRQRKDNLAVLQQCYVEMQKQALTMNTSLKNGQGLKK